MAAAGDRAARIHVRRRQVGARVKTEGLFEAELRRQ
jgi:hypothetical protein